MAPLKVLRIDTAKFRVPLRTMARSGGRQVEARTGRMVRLLGDDGSVGFGEATPLPGLHTETLQDVDRVLEDACSGLTGQEFPEFQSFALHVANRVAALGHHGDVGNPSACFALQTAGLGLFATSRKTLPAALLGPQPRPQVPLNGYFDGDAGDARRALEDGELAGYPRVKVKLGRRSAAEDREVLATLLAGLPDSVLLRADANRTLSLGQALEILRGLPAERFEYVEEPLRDPSEFVELNSRTGLALALDECLHDPSLYYLGRAPYVAAWIVKPALIGHWQRIEFLAKEAERADAGCVISSCLETGLGLHAQVQMAAALPGRALAAGLATDRLLKVDTVDPPFDSRPGQVGIRQWRGAPSAAVRRQLGFADET